MIFHPAINTWWTILSPVLISCSFGISCFRNMLYYRTQMGCKWQYQLKSFPHIFLRLFLICHNIPIAQVAAAGLSLIDSEHLCASVPLSNLLSLHPSAQMQYVCLECYCCSFAAHVSVGLANEMLSWWWVPHRVISSLFMARFLLGNMCLDLRRNLGCDIQAPWCPLCCSVLFWCFTVRLIQQNVSSEQPALYR